jgi:hypothetical protein
MFGFALYEFITTASAVLGGPEVLFGLLVAGGIAADETVRALIRYWTRPWYSEHPVAAAIAAVATVAAVIGAVAAIRRIDLNAARAFLNDRVRRGLLSSEARDRVVGALSRVVEVKSRR